MHQMDLSAIDLNLVVALDALLRTRSVTRAARALGRSQPAVSHALARLREVFDDPLLVRAGRGLTPTPRAEALREPLSQVLAELSGLFAPPGAFDPARCDRTFRLALPDLLAAFIPGWVAAIETEAPNVRLEVRRPFGPNAVAALADGRCDLAMMARFTAPESAKLRVIGRIEWVTVMRPGHPLLDGADRETPVITPEAWAACRHVEVATGLGAPSWVERAVRAAGLTRRKGLTVETFLLAPPVVAQSDQLFTAGRALIAPLAERYGLVMVEPPIPVPPLDGVAVWHARYQHDPAHRWLRELLVTEAAERLTARARPG